jgi:hypothetical protein
MRELFGNRGDGIRTSDRRRAVVDPVAEALIRREIVDAGFGFGIAKHPSLTAVIAREHRIEWRDEAAALRFPKWISISPEKRFELSRFLMTLRCSPSTLPSLA